MGEFSATVNVINAMTGFAEKEGQGLARPVEKTDAGNTVGERSPNRAAAPCLLLVNTTTSGSINDEKPVLKFDDHFDGGFQF